ncbi:hypothetical protein K503DRAFT_858671 [Rhizopogon vinicolor AM-OR11-026]|uniref:Uncharacterized protein n=1 Tax=Rhizopogon vinicolor AM-OR11-026 TaxID=1314800 RepID=A0A1B7MRX9_9AGAM|nr:hypothetical protein K503DRAFT_858671 [Rhizopogon vinicolor AM-OR11-026]
MLGPHSYHYAIRNVAVSILSEQGTPGSPPRPSFQLPEVSIHFEKKSVIKFNLVLIRVRVKQWGLAWSPQDVSIAHQAVNVTEPQAPAWKNAILDRSHRRKNDSALTRTGDNMHIEVLVFKEPTSTYFQTIVQVVRDSEAPSTSISTFFLLSANYTVRVPAMKPKKCYPS